MPHVLNLADVLQHPDDGLHPDALAQQEFVLDLHHPVLHVPFNPDDQPDSLRQELLGEALRNVPLIADRPTEELPGEGLADQRGPVVGVARGEPGLNDLPAALTAWCSLNPRIQPMVPQPCAARPRMVQCCRSLGVASRQRGRVHDGDVGAPALGADAQEEQQLGEHLLLPRLEAAAGEHPREIRSAARADPPEVEGLQGPAAQGVK